MQDVILSTKLHIPAAHELIERPRLMDQLDEILHRRLALLSAPAGFGKTSLLCSWLRQQETPVAWLSLDESDNDPARFVNYLVAALRRVVPNVGATALSLLHPPAQPLQQMVVLLINDLEQVRGDIILVLDDYHLITEQNILNAIAYLVEHQPAALHLVIATRVDPPLPFARLRGRGQMVELRASDLRFTIPEAEQFLGKVMHIDLSDEDISALQQRVEGWIAGLQMVAVALRGCSDLSAYIHTLTGNNRFILDYLMEEVLQHQPEPLQDFLVRTAILDRLCAPLCAAVTGQTGCQETLEQIGRANLFISALDDQRQWYRYHNLFADLLRQRLRQTHPELEPDLHQRASAWYEQNHLPQHAIEHALAAQAYPRAAGLVARVAPGLMMSDEISTVSGWLAKLPGEVLLGDPQVALCQIWAWILRSQVMEAETLSRQLQEQPYFSASQNAPLTGQLKTIEAMLALYRGDMKQANTGALAAYDLLAKDDLFHHGIIAWLLGFSAYINDENYETSDRILREGIEANRAAGNQFMMLLSIYTLGSQQLLRGQVFAAKDTFQRGLQEIGIDKSHLGTLPAGLPSSAAMMLNGMGDVLRELNDLPLAEQFLQKSVELGIKLQNAEMLADEHMSLARLRFSQGDIPAALEAIRNLTRLTGAANLGLITIRQVSALQAWLWVQSGEIIQAVSWAKLVSEKQAEDPVGTPMFIQIVEGLTLARVDLALDQPKQAEFLLQGIMPLIRQIGWVSFLIQVQLLQARVLWQLGEQTAALEIVRQVIETAASCGIFRTIIDEGPAVKEMLSRLHRAVSSDNLVHPYLDRLLQVFDEKRTSPTAFQGSALPEPLSERELEVLHLLSDGLSNQEIAARTFTALATVKSHTNHIYHKLGVSSRTQAVAVAKKKGLI